MWFGGLQRIMAFAHEAEYDAEANLRSSLGLLQPDLRCGALVLADRGRALYFCWATAGEDIAMNETIEPLIGDLVEWVSKEPRSYSEVMDVWRTSCPRLTVWEDAVDRGYLVRERVAGGSIAVKVTPEGRKFLAARNSAPAASGNDQGR